MIIKADINDINVAAELAFKLWKHHTIDELKKEFINVLENNKSVVFIKYISDKPIGFAFCSLRNDYVEGSSTNPVGYLEGIFIDEPYRCKGYAKNLLSECEKWAKSHKCIEFASDCSIVSYSSSDKRISLSLYQILCKFLNSHIPFQIYLKQASSF